MPQYAFEYTSCGSYATDLVAAIIIGCDIAREETQKRVVYQLVHIFVGKMSDKEPGECRQRSVGMRIGIDGIHYLVRLQTHRCVKGVAQFCRSYVFKAVAHKHLSDICALSFVAEYEAERPHMGYNIFPVVQT